MVTYSVPPYPGPFPKIRRVKASKPIPTVTIGRYCSHEGCRRAAHHARWMGTFWICFCDEHWGSTINLDFSKIPSPTKGTQP
jgi:hypothetical protein